jgi:hypothetical protein
MTVQPVHYDWIILLHLHLAQAPQRANCCHYFFLHPQREEAELDELTFYEPLLNNRNNQSKAIFDSFLNYPINARAFPPRLPNITTKAAQYHNHSQEDPVFIGHLNNNPERFQVQNYRGNTIVCGQASNGE